MGRRTKEIYGDMNDDVEALGTFWCIRVVVIELILIIRKGTARGVICERSELKAFYVEVHLGIHI